MDEHRISKNICEKKNVRTKAADILLLSRVADMRMFVIITDKCSGFTVYQFIA